MTKTQRLRMTLDIAMTLLSVALMGGTMLFPSDKAHQILGMVLLALWAAHVALNRRWYASLFRGAYPPYRVMQIFVNAGIALCALLAAASGMMMAWFMPASFVLGPARVAHLVGTHWYYLFLCAHLGMHVGQVASRLGTGRGGQKKTLARRGVWQYLFLRQQFFFLNLERGYVLFAADYVAILVLFSAAAHYAGKLLSRTKRAKNGNDATA